MLYIFYHDLYWVQNAFSDHINNKIIAITPYADIYSIIIHKRPRDAVLRQMHKHIVVCLSLYAMIDSLNGL